MTPAAKTKLAQAIRDCSEFFISAGYSKDKKLLRYNDISFTYRVIRLMNGSKLNWELDESLLKDLVGACFKDHPMYSGESVKTWAWTWAIPTVRNVNRV
jgi:hypothetical protein